MAYTNFQFPGQKNNEKIRFVLRKNWLVDFAATIKLLIIGILPPILAISLSMIFISDHSSSLFYAIISLALFYFAFAIQYTHISWMNDELDLIVVTNERIIDITEVNFLAHNTVEAPLNQIQDVRGEINGFMGTLFRYGTIKIYTANHTAILELDSVTEPMLAARRILDHIHGRRHRQENILPEEIIKEKNAIIRNVKAFQSLRDNMVTSIRNLFNK